MKRAHLIFIAVVLAAAFCWTISPSPALMPALSMRSLGPTGSLWIRTNAMGLVETGPRWSFAITNSSRAPASWWAYLRFTDTNIPIASTVGMDGRLVQGRLLPHKQAVISMAVPGDTNITWRGTISYCRGPSHVELAVWPVVKHVPWLSNNFWLREEGANCDDVWRTTANPTAPH
jgi:hypothetical protein